MATMVMMIAGGVESVPFNKINWIAAMLECVFRTPCEAEKTGASLHPTHEAQITVGARDPGRPPLPSMDCFLHHAMVY